MTIETQIHSSIGIKAKATDGDNCSWVELEMGDKFGGAHNVCLYFDNRAMAHAYADAINSITVAHELGEQLAASLSPTETLEPPQCSA